MLVTKSWEQLLNTPDVFYPTGERERLAKSSNSFGFTSIYIYECGTYDRYTYHEHSNYVTVYIGGTEYYIPKWTIDTME